MYYLHTGAIRSLIEALIQKYNIDLVWVRRTAIGATIGVNIAIGLGLGALFVGAFLYTLGVDPMREAGYATPGELAYAFGKVFTWYAIVFASIGAVIAAATYPYFARMWAIRFVGYGLLALVAWMNYVTIFMIGYGNMSGPGVIGTAMTLVTISVVLIAFVFHSEAPRMSGYAQWKLQKELSAFE